MLDVNPTAATATASHSFHSFPSELHPAERFAGRQGEEGKGATTRCSAQELLRAAATGQNLCPRHHFKRHTDVFGSGFSSKHPPAERAVKRAHILDFAWALHLLPDLPCERKWGLAQNI